MNFKYFGIVLVLLLALVGTAYAAAPTVSDVTVSSTYTADKNYFATPVTLSVTASGDVNADSLCWYNVSTGGTDFAGDWNEDTNICSVTLSSVAGTDDFNFAFIVQSGTGDANTTSNEALYWLDTNAPSPTETSSGQYVGTTVTISCSDTATNTGDGAGCKNIFYSTNGGTSYSSTTNSSVTLQLNTIGSYDVNYYVVDNLDNTSATSQTSYTITTMPASSYGMISLALFIAATALVIFAVFGIFNGKLDIEQFIMVLVAVLIVLVVAWTIYSTTIVV